MKEVIVEKHVHYLLKLIQMVDGNKFLQEVIMLSINK